jgi:hypothetical protein
MDYNNEQIALLTLMVKLDILGVRRVHYTMAQAMAGIPAPYGVKLAALSPSREFLQWVPKSKYPGTFWVAV